MDTDITSQIQTLIEKTKNDKINWQHLNNNAYRWIRKTNDGQIYNVTLQSNPIGMFPVGIPTPGVPMQMQPASQFVLTIQSNTGELILQVQSHLQLNQIYLPLLEQLIKIIEEKSKLKSTNILNKLLENL
jgi:hypothetical protein